MNKNYTWLFSYPFILFFFLSEVSKAAIPAWNATTITFNDITLFENRPAGTPAGSIGISPGNMLNTYTFTLVPGKGDCSNDLFKIEGNKVTTQTPLDYEEKSTHCIRVRATAQDGSTIEKSFSIEVRDVNERPTLDPISDQSLCIMAERGYITLKGVSPGPEKKQKTSFSVSAENPDLFEELSVSPGGELVYRIREGMDGRTKLTVVVKDNGGIDNGGEDTFSQQFNITIAPPPVIAITSSKGNSISKGEIVELLASGAASYEWINPNGAISGSGSAALTVRPSETTVYRVQATSLAGCTVEQEIRIEVKDDYLALIPTNVITPNSDGKNDRLVVKNIDLYPDNEIRIFDKAGRMLFSKKNYRDEWDGTFQGSTLEEGAYYYVIDFGKNNRQFKGHVTIIRD
jgi:gliding motility-associated-like protein